MLPLRYRRPVKLDVVQAYRWYQQQRPGLGTDWLLCLEETLSRISRNPELFGKIKNQIRCAQLHRFPYSVYFRIEDNSVLVYGVFHSSRDSRHWQSRI